MDNYEAERLKRSSVTSMEAKISPPELRSQTYFAIRQKEKRCAELYAAFTSMSSSMSLPSS